MGTTEVVVNGMCHKVTHPRPEIKGSEENDLGKMMCLGAMRKEVINPDCKV